VSDFGSLSCNNRRKIKDMDISDIGRKLSLDNNKLLIRKAAEIRRLCDAQFDSSIIGVVR